MELLDVHNLPGPNDIFTNRYIRRHWPEFSEVLDDEYPVGYTLREKLWLHSNGLSERPKCPVCGKETKFLSIARGYQEYCCMKCRCNSPEYITKKSGPRKNKEEVQEKIRKTTLERYGVDNVFKSAEIKNRIKETLYNHYGVEHPAKSPEIQQKIQDTYKRHCGDPMFRESINNKKKATYIERLKADPDFIKNKNEKISTGISRAHNYHCSEDPSYAEAKKQKISNGVINAYRHIKENSPEVIEERYKKSYDTKKHNHSFNTSRIEEDFAHWLDSYNISYKRQYRSDVYPFACDFYFPDKDLYFEINASWTHGGHPFDPDSITDRHVLTEWKNKNSKYYDNAIEAWTVRDVKKHGIAKERHLNWTAVYSNNIEDIIEEYDRH